jgi:DNA-binding CsgD family transcriptional regulator
MGGWQLDRSLRARSAVADVAYTAFSTSAGVAAGTRAPGADLMSNVLQAYNDAIGAETAGVYEHVRDGWTKACFILPAQAWLRLPYARMRTSEAAALHPGVRHSVAAAPTEPFAITDLVPQRTWLDSALGRAMKPDWGCNLQLMSPIATRPHSSVCQVWVLGRASSDFTVADRDVALALQPLLAAVTRHYVGASARDLPAEAAALLTERESAVMKLLLTGDRAAAIARQLDMSVRTVNKHIERIYRKFAVHDRHALTHVVNRDMCGNIESGDTAESIQ